MSKIPKTNELKGCTCIFATQVFSSLKDTEQPAKYISFLDRYRLLPSANDRLLSANDRMKRAMTDVAFEMTKRVWQDLDADVRGNCFFCIGGVNAVNPFSATAVKNEIVVYADAVSEDAQRIDPTEGAFYDMSGKALEQFDLEGYDEIYMDFNGSMAFFNAEWEARVANLASLRKVLRDDQTSHFP
jgi:hypothetical protein